MRDHTPATPCLSGVAVPVRKRMKKYWPEQNQAGQAQGTTHRKEGAAQPRLCWLHGRTPHYNRQRGTGIQQPEPPQATTTVVTHCTRAGTPDVKAAPTCARLGPVFFPAPSPSPSGQGANGVRGPPVRTGCRPCPSAPRKNSCPDGQSDRRQPLAGISGV